MRFEKHCWAEIDLDALLNNYRFIRRTVGGDVCAVLKADAYGHGALAVADALRAAGCAAFAVSCLAEARELRRHGLTEPLLILGYTDPAFADELAALDITRRLMLNAEVNARTFKAGAPFDWNAPAQPKKRNPYLVPIIVLAVLLVALAVACWYFFSHFTLGSEQDNVPAASVSSAAQQLPESGSASLPESVPQSQSAAADGTDASAPASQTAPAASTPAADANGVVSPFA